jgi:hypothetical protein
MCGWLVVCNETSLQEILRQCLCFVHRAGTLRLEPYPSLQSFFCIHIQYVYNGFYLGKTSCLQQDR